jgi:hypothetical protein
MRPYTVSLGVGYCRTGRSECIPSGGGGGGGGERCHWCFSAAPAGAPLPCAHCASAVYCSRRCRAEAWKAVRVATSHTQARTHTQDA